MWKYFFLKENTKIRWWFCVLCSIYIVLFTYMLEPLKNEQYHYNYPEYYNYIALVGFFLISLLLCIYIPFQFSSFFEEKSWTFARFMMWFLLWILVGVVFAFFLDFYGYGFQYNAASIFSYFFNFQFAVDAFTVLPILFFFLSSYPSLNLRKVDDNPKVITLAIDIPNIYSIAPKSGNAEPKNNTTVLSFIDKNGKKELRIRLDQLFYITSADNYVDIIYNNEENKLSSMTFRNTLKLIEAEYSDIKDIFRCHKAFIVNCEKVKAIKGNAKGYFLVLEEVNEKIPVSRNKNEDLEKLFPHLL